MSSICNDFAHIVEVVNDFLYFLGPDLKSVTGDVASVDIVVEVSYFLYMYPCAIFEYIFLCKVYYIYWTNLKFLQDIYFQIQDTKNDHLNIIDHLFNSLDSNILKIFSKIQFTWFKPIKMYLKSVPFLWWYS